MKWLFNKWGMLAMSALSAFAAVAVVFACYNPPDTGHQFSTDSTGFAWAVSNDDGHTTNIGGYNPIDPGDNGSLSAYDYWKDTSTNKISSSDPYALQSPGGTITQYTKDVAKTTVSVIDSGSQGGSGSGCYSDNNYCYNYSNCGTGTTSSSAAGSTIAVTMTNTYPLYHPTVFCGVDNNQDYDVTVDSITIAASSSYITVSFGGITQGQTISAGKEVICWFSADTVQSPNDEGKTYTFTITLVLTQIVQSEQGGNSDFWKNYSSCYTKSKCETWLCDLDKDSSSKWLGPRTCTDMVSWMGKYNSGSAKDKFLACYLALRMDADCGRKALTNTYDIRGQDSGNYLGLSNPSHATLSQICSAIENKYGTSLSDSRYNTMKNICDYIDNIGK